MSTATTVVGWDEVPSPIGPFLVAGEGRRILEVRLPATWTASSLPAGWRREVGVVEPAAAQLAEYFDGTRTAFDLELAPRGTEFQLAVWSALEAIPYRATASYRDVAP